MATPTRDSGPTFALAAAFSLTHISPGYYARAKRALDALAREPQRQAADDVQILYALRQDPALLAPADDVTLARLARLGAVTAELVAVIEATTRHPLGRAARER